MKKEPKIGDVFLAEVKYEDKPSIAKTRPVIVIDVHDDQITVLAVSITSQGVNRPPRYFDKYKLFIEEWEKCGLNKKSYAKVNQLHIFTKKALKRYIGSLTDHDLEKVILAVAQYLEEEP